MAHEVFICYASRDKAVADAVCDALEANHIKCWIAPRDVLPGMEWAEAIVDAIDESRVLVLVFSASSNTSPQVRREVGRAAGNDIPIVPFRIDDVVPSKAMDFFVSSHHWLDAQTGPLEKHLKRLVDTVQQILARKRAPQEAVEKAEAEERAKKEAEEARRAKEAEEKAEREAEEARKAKEAEEKAKKEAELAAKEIERRVAREAKERAKREAEEARRAKEAEKKPPVFVERPARPVKVGVPLLKRRWLWAGAGAVLVALVCLFVFVLPSSETPSVSPPGEEEEEQPPAEEEEEVEGAWWDNKWGEPEYGGTLVYRAGFIDVVTNPLDPRSAQFGAWLEALFMDDMTVDREEFSFLCNFFPLEYRAGQLAESWEQPDPSTVVVHLRQGVVWKGGPAEGRPFTSADIVYTYDKILGVGEFAGEMPDPIFSSVMPHIAEVVAPDDYTVEFRLSSPGPFTAYEVVMPWLSIPIAPREFYELTPEEQADWHNVTGTGPFIIEDYVAGTSMTCARNEDYYGIDARYGNKLPYADELKILVVPDMDAALSALRTGQIDLLVDARTYPTSADTLMLAQTNPEIIHFQQPVMAPAIFFHWNQDTGTITPPFNDIRVRKAMQLAINNEEIAATYYQGTVDGLPCGLMSPLSGEEWDYSFDEWPAELQAEYTYDLAAAQQLMAEAAADGVFTPNDLGGFDTEILTCVDDFPEVLEIIQAMLLDIGIDMTINAVPMMEARPVIQAGDFETLWVSMVGDTNSSPQSSIQSFYSQKFERVGQGGGVIDAGYDAIVERCLAASTMSEAQAIFKEADRYWLEQHWAVITFPSWSNQFTQPWIKGYNGERFWSTMTWTYLAHMWIDQAIRAQLGK